MDGVFFFVATLCYCAGTVGWLINLARDSRPVHMAALGVFVAGALLHGAAIVMRSLAVGHIAATTPQEALSLFAWVLAVVYLLAQLRFDLRLLGAFVAPLAVVFMLASAMAPGLSAPESGIFRSGWVIAHVSLLFAANALFALAAVTGVMYLLQERHIKRKSFGLMYRRLPSLDRLDAVNRACLLFGFPLMTVGLITGFAYAASVWKVSFSWTPKEVFALATWLIYAVLLHQRLTVGWRGRRAALLSIAGFVAVLATFLGVNLLIGGHHAILAS